MKNPADIVVTMGVGTVRGVVVQFARLPVAPGALVCCTLLASLSVSADDSLRPSLTGPEAVQTRRAAAASLTDYNLRLGPSAWTLAASTTLEANDNLRADAESSQADVIVRPAIEASMRLPLSQANTLNLKLAGGYALYATHSEYDRPFITPGSELAFDLYAGAFWLNFHDRFAIVENACLDPTVTDIADYERLDNAAGVSALCDLNRLILKVGYDHLNYIPLHSDTGIPGYSQPDGESEAFSSSVASPLSSVTLAGVEAGASVLHYGAPRANAGFIDGVQANAGGLFETQLTDYIRAEAHGGYTSFKPSGTGADFSGFYVQASGTHRLNQFVEYTLGAGRMLHFGFYGGLLDQYFASLEAQWHFIRKVTLSSGIYYQHGKQLGVGREEFDWLTAALSASRRLTENLNARLGCQFYWRDSDVAGRDYTVKVVTAGLEYKF